MCAPTRNGHRFTVGTGRGAARDSYRLAVGVAARGTVTVSPFDSVIGRCTVTVSLVDGASSRRTVTVSPDAGASARRTVTVSPGAEAWPPRFTVTVSPPTGVFPRRTVTVSSLPLPPSRRTVIVSSDMATPPLQLQSALHRPSSRSPEPRHIALRTTAHMSNRSQASAANAPEQSAHRCHRNRSDSDRPEASRSS